MPRWGFVAVLLAILALILAVAKGGNGRVSEDPSQPERDSADATEDRSILRGVPLRPRDPTVWDDAVVGLILNAGGRASVGTSIALRREWSLAHPDDLAASARWTRAREDGSFAFRQLDPAGTYRIIVPGDETYEHVEIASVRTGERHSITRHPGARLNVFVDEGGEPAMDIAVVLRLVSAANARTPQTLVTGAHGTAVFVGIPGGAVVEITSPSGAFKPTFVRMPGTGSRDVRIVARPRKALRIRLLDAETDAGIEGARVAPAGMPDRQGTSWTTDARGETEVPVHGTWTKFQVEAAGYPRNTYLALGGPQVTFRLRRGGSVTGRLDGPGGVPVSDAEVALFPVPGGTADREPPSSSRSSQVGRSRADGGFEFGDVDCSGRYVLHAISASGLRGAVAFELTSTPTDLGAVRMTSGSVVEVLVVDDGGTPVAGATIELYALADDVDPAAVEVLSVLPRRILTTGASGTCEAYGLEPGACSLTLFDGGWSTRRFFEVPRGGMVSQKVVVPKVEQATVSVVDRGGVPQAAIKVLATGRGGEASTGVTDDAGMAVLRLPTLPVRLRVPAQYVAGRQVTSTVEDLQWPGPTVLTIEPHEVQEGLVIDDHSHTVPGAVLAVLRSTGGVDEVLADMQGRFVVRDLAGRSDVVFLGSSISGRGVIDTELAGFAADLVASSGVFLHCWRVSPDGPMTIGLRDAHGRTIPGRAVSVMVAGDLSVRQESRYRGGVSDTNGEVHLMDVADLPLLILVRGVDPQSPPSRFVRRREREIILVVTD